MGHLNSETTFSMASTGHLRDRRESILSAREVCERLSDAEASYYLSPEEPARKAMLTMCWDQSDTTGSTDSDTIVSLMSEVFGFKTEQFKIPTEQSLNRTKAKILEFISDYDTPETQIYKPRSLLVFHYAGHGNGDNGLSVSGTADFKTEFKFDHLRDTVMTHSHGNILFILDCCNAAAVVREKNNRTVEILAACGETETATDVKYSTFTSHIDKIARRLSTEESVTVESIARALWPTSYNRVPFFHRVQGSKPIALKPIRPPGQSAQNDPAAQKDLPPVWVVIQVHVTDQLSSNEISELESDIDLVRVREDYKGGMITKISVQHGSIVTFALPAPIYEWLENDPHFSYQGLAPKESQNKSKESTILERYTRLQNRITSAEDVSRSVSRTVVNLYHLAEEFQFSNNAASSRDSLVKLLRILQERFGRHHFSTVGTLKRIAMLHLRLGEWDESVKRLREAVDICEKYYGRDHTETREMLAMLE